MTRAAVVLRPEPGNARTAERLAAAGLKAVRLPLFIVRPLDWQAPDPDAYDALLLTSANAIRHAGSALALLAALPVYAVGEATAAAARAAGLHVAATGTHDAAAAAALARAAGAHRLLHLAGREHVAVAGATALPVYASEPVAITPAQRAALPDSVALLHSARAAAAFAHLVPPSGRTTIRLAAISAAVADAAGEGWQARAVATSPTDAALVALARTLAD